MVRPDCVDLASDEDGNRTKIYMVNVTRAASDDATLSALVPG